MHRLFFLGAIFTPTKDEDLLVIRPVNQLYLQPGMHHTPVCFQQLGLVLFQLPTVGAQNISAAFLVQKIKICLAGHSSVHDPNAVGFPVSVFHGLNNLFYGRHICTISCKYFIAQGKTIPCHDQADTNLLTIPPLVSRVTPLSQRIAFGLSFKISARNVIEVEVIIHFE